MGQAERSVQNRQADSPWLSQVDLIITASVQVAGEAMAEVSTAGWSHLAALSPVGSCLTSMPPDTNRTDLVLFTVTVIRVAGRVV